VARTQQRIAYAPLEESLVAELQDKITKRTETFWIYSIARGGDDMLQGPYTVQIICDYTIQFTQPSTFLTYYAFAAGNPFETLVYPAWTTSNVYCPV